MSILLPVVLEFWVLAGSAQHWTTRQMQNLVESKKRESLFELKEFLSLPNDAHFQEHVAKNVSWCTQAFSRRGFRVTEHPTDGGPPILIAEKEYGKVKTVLFYLQVDGQPVDPTKWFQDDPYQPVLKEKTDDGYRTIDWPKNKKWNDEWRIFARSASDAKGPIIMFLSAIDIMSREGKEPDFNIKVIMDFEEEMGSPHLPKAVSVYKKELSADMLLILDGPMHVSNQPTLKFGARGITTITLNVFGPRFPQHSGHYGNYIPNPAFRLAQLLSSMKDEQGRVTIAGFYDGILIDDATRQILREVPDNEEAIRETLGIADIDKVADNLQEAIQYPSLNIRGLSAGWVGDEARTIIPSTAVAEIDVRLVKETNSDRLVRLIKEHVANKGYHFVNGEPTDEERKQYSKLIRFIYDHSYDAFRTDFDSVPGQWLNDALSNAFDSHPVRLRTSGGSIPISPFVTTLQIPAVSVPTVNADNNQHSPNENLRLGNLSSGILTYLAILSYPLTGYED